MQLTVELLKPTAKSLVITAGGKEYFAKKDSGITAGMTIDVETEDSAYNGKTYTWIQKWKQVGGAAPKTNGGTPPSYAVSAWLPMASNTVAHAIAAGLIKEPTQIRKWVKEVKEAVENPDVPF